MIRTAALATVMLLTTTLAAHAGWSTEHRKHPSPGIDPVTTQGTGDTTSPGDPFYPPVNTGATDTPRTPMPQIECWIEIDENGHAIVHLKNLSGKSLPAGPSVAVVLGDGSKFHASTWEGWPPGQVYEYGQLNYDGRLTCTATIDIEEDEDDVPH